MNTKKEKEDQMRKQIEEKEREYSDRIKEIETMKSQ
jgi:hypothetical protein